MVKKAALLGIATLFAISSACSDTSPTVVDAVGYAVEEPGRLAFPDVIPLPVDPDGIAVGTGPTFFVGDFEGDAGIYKGDLRTGVVRLLRAADGRPTTGLKYDERSGYLFAARGESGWATILDAGTGDIVADFQLASNQSYVNDVVVTPSAAYFTESLRPLIYRVPLDRTGRPAGAFDVLELSGDFVQAPLPCRGVRSPITSNGIEATANGEWLILNTFVDGALYRVDPTTGDARRIDLGRASLCFADGNLLVGRTLYVMQNVLGRMAVVRLSLADLSGRVDGYVAGPYPMTTMARYQTSIYAVTAVFESLPARRQVMRFSLAEDLDENGLR
jgi:sugar lactone lactonase YvrE